jgi:hypothetical protein
MKLLKILLVSFFSLQSAYVLAQSIQITSPQSGADWCYLKPYQIRWNKTGQMGNEVRITLFHANGQSVKRVLANRVANSGSFSWTVDVNDFKNYIMEVATWSSAQYPTIVKNRVNFRIKDCRKPDLRVTSRVVGLEASRTKPIQKYLRYRATVKNHGDAKAGPSKTRVTIIGPDTQHTTWDTPELAPNATHSKSFRYKINKPGRYYNKAETDVFYNVTEKTDYNNSHQTPRYTIVGPDLVPCIMKRYNIRINVKSGVYAEAKNIGNYYAPPSRLCIWVKKKGKRCYNVPRLMPGQKHKIHRTIRWYATGSSKYYAEVDPGNKIRESRENNNKIYGLIIKKRKYSANPTTQFRCRRQ